MRNRESVAIDFTGCTLQDEASHTYAFPDGFQLSSGATVDIFSGKGTNTAGSLYWGSGSPIWNNDGDTATLRNDKGQLVETYSY